MHDEPVKHLSWLQLLALAALRVVGTTVDVVCTVPQPRLWRWWVAQLVSPSPWRATPPLTPGLVEDDFIYGEVSVASAWWLLRRLGVGQGQLLVDLGCGRGAALVAGLLCGAHARGVELVPARLEAALSLVPAVALVVQDAREADVADADVVWLSWATWSPAVRAAVASHLAARLAPHALVVGVVHELDTAAFEPVLRARLWSTWGRTDVVVSRRRA